MKKILILMVATVALLAFSQAHASQVTNVELSYNGGFTIARISVDGPIRFTHQTEEAKDGKPFRVIVDILAATHDLGAQTFTFLPDCPIKSIRSSQYSVNPEKVVRIVFDMDSERVYRVESDSHYITVYFSDNVPRSFAPWSTSTYVASMDQPEHHETSPKMAVSEPPATHPKSAEELNSAIDKDRLSSLGTRSATVPENKPATTPSMSESTAPARAVAMNPTPQQPVSTMKSEPKPAESRPSTKTFDKSYGPMASMTDINTPVNQPTAPAVKQVAKQPEVQQPKAAVKEASAPVHDQHPTEQAHEKSLAASEAPARKAATVASTMPEQKSEPKVAAKATPKQEESKPAPKVESTPAPAQQMAQQPAEDKSAEDGISTSRFRRAPAETGKIKGTLVAEFPKRLVIKYKTSGFRDPFETLINDAKVDNNPIEKRVPNVEGLKLVGIIESGGGDNRALFEDGDGYGYILATGDKVQKGYVLKVDPDRVYFQIFEYGWSRTVALNLESKS